MHAENRSKLLLALQSFRKGFGLLLCYELIEEFLEEAIAWTITTVAAKAISFLLVVFATQTIKVTAKSIFIVLKPVVKRLIYKEGNDKMNALKALLKNLKANWKNYLGIVSAVATAVIPFVQQFMDFGLNIRVFGYNIVPFVLIILTSLVAVIGVLVDGVHGNELWSVIVAAKKSFAEEVATQKQQAKLAKQEEKAKALPEPEKVEEPEIVPDKPEKPRKLSHKSIKREEKACRDEIDTYINNIELK